MGFLHLCLESRLCPFVDDDVFHLFTLLLLSSAINDEVCGSFGIRFSIGWTITKSNEKRAWNKEWLRMLRLVRHNIPKH